MSSLIIAIVETGNAEPLMQKAKQAGSTGGTILSGRGTASSSLLCLLGLGDSHKEILMTLVEDETMDAVWQTLCTATQVRGVLAKTGAYRPKNASSSSPKGTYELINIICPAGYADDLMAAARKAGAGGGTIIEGRGTANADDLLFFGSSLVSEKEVLLILVQTEQVPAVLSAISALPVLQAEGSGIAFTFSIQEVTKLGK
ncbi:MAG: transcriptional regulator [Sphaerochaeta sp.]|uniref:P-II family nitrogen regulator n=1 Tax=Sphaerochaeta sp. TaxID=1972642 RepID=UPI003D0BC814